MCERNKANLKFFYVLLVSLFTCFAGVLQAEELWYLISETELRSIEEYQAKSEREKQSWLLQARELKQDSANLNAQLTQARERNRRLEQSFNELEAEQLTRLSLKNGEIAELKQEAADKTLEAAKWKGKALLFLAVIIAFIAVAAVIIVIRIKRII